MEEFTRRKNNGELEEFCGLVDSSKVYVDTVEGLGFGVFARQDIEEDEIVEVGIMYRLEGIDGNKDHHVFTWSDDRTVWAAGSGCIPFYNHTSYSPNIKKVGDLENDRMMIIALRDIRAGEELRNTYYSAKWREIFVEEKLAEL